MSAPETWTCPQCGIPADISETGFCAEVACPACGHTELVHTLLANFRLESVLGIGGMSTVYRARDMVLNRTVAIKVLHNSELMDSAESRARFETEAALMAKVRHENVVSVYSAGWAGQHFYLAMELAEGTNLELLVTERKCLLPGEALELVRQVAMGLQAADAAGVLHRDVKPGNVIITPGGTAKVLDFGLALEDKPMEESDGIIWATPFYVPPETLRREQEDARADIYALGMTLRHLLTGSDKLADDAPQSISELLAAKEQLPSFAERYPKLGESLGELIDHMTAFSVADRPAGYAELLEEIVEVQAKIGKGGLRGLHRRREAHRNRIISGVVGGLLAGAAAAGVIAFTGPVVYEYEALTPAPSLRWEEWDTLEQAHAAAQNHDLEGAQRLFTELAQRTAHPDLGAVAALHAVAYAILNGAGEADIAALQELFASQLASQNAPQPALQKLYELLRERRFAPLPSGLRAAAAAMRSREIALKGNTREAERFLDMAIAAAQEEDACCGEQMRRALADFKSRLPQLVGTVQRARLRQALNRGDFATARDCFAQLENAQLTPLERQEVAVQQEVCEAAEALFAAMQRHDQKAFKPDDAPDALAAQAAVLAPSPFRNEALSLICMLRGDYARASLTNPYRGQPDARAPFAVLMRDWLKRLGR